MELSEDIICPYCEHHQDSETMYEHVTYWGGKGKKECICESCGEDFLVEEYVTREFSTSKKQINDELGEQEK